MREQLINKFCYVSELKTGKATKTLDTDFGFPESYIVVLTRDERLYILDMLRRNNGL